MRTNIVLVWAAMALALSAGVQATVLHVPDEYPTIQAGIDAAVEGDTVLVAEGTHTGDGNRDITFDGKAILLTSESGPEATIIDCQGSYDDPHRGFCFHSGENLASVLRGFTIKNGYIAPTGNGGGIECWSSSPTIEGNVISGNVALGFTEGDGGGISCYQSSPSIIGNRISGNAAQCYGGGISCRYYCFPTIDGNTITQNSAGESGGGVFCHYYSSPTVIDCILWGDSTSLYGGAEITVQIESAITVSFSDVQGGSSAVAVHPTSTLYWGEGNIDADPLFVGGPQGDFHLSQLPLQPDQSPCVDAGAPDSSVPEGTTRTDEICDLFPVDMGYHYYPCTGAPGPVLWVNAVPDTTQVHRGEDLWFTVDLVNLTDSTLVFDGWVDGYLFNGNLYAGNPVLGPVVLGLGGGQGLYGVRRHVTIPWAAPFGSPYRLCVRTGEHPDSIWAEDCFECAIVPPPAE